MSDEDNPFDEDELRDAGLIEDNGDSLSPEEVFSLVMVNRKRLVRTKIELRDKDNNVIPLHEVIDSLVEYMKGKLNAEESNQFADQIFPMMGQALVSGLGRFIGNSMTGFYLANETSRNSLMYMMCMSFLLLKYVQDKKLTIVALDEPVTPDELESIERKSKATSMAMMSSLMGMSPKEIMKELVDKGELSEEEVQEVMAGGKKKDDGPIH